MSTDLLPFLKTVPLFAELNDRTLALLASVCRVKCLPKDAVLFHQGDPGDAAYIVRSGAIAITLAAPDGRELVVYEMQRGDCLGELALLTNQSRSAAAVAREESEVLVIPRDEFLSRFASEPALMRRLLEIIAQRLRFSTEQEGALAFSDAPARLARVLLLLDRDDNGRGYVTISQEEISKRTGIARQTAAKILGQWRRAGWIITGRGRVVILNRAALRRAGDEFHSTS